ncbi:hypothetical protein I4U23_012660 [Adineta vaga]|nr:hypothetical protein I4U23_012660 [Adineta vaga]
MVLYTMLNGDGEAPSIPHQKQRRSTWKSAWVRAGAGCLLLAGISLIAAIVLYNSVSIGNKSTASVEKKKDLYETVLEIVLTTDYAFNDDSQAFNIRNLDAMAEQLTTKLNGRALRVINGFFRNDYESKRTICEDTLSGNILELHIVPSYAVQCTSSDDTKCKSRLVKQLRSMFHRQLSFLLTIQFSDDQSNEVNTKVCDVKAIDEHRDESIASATPIQRSRRKRTTTKPLTSIIEEPAEVSLEIGAGASEPQRARNYSIHTLHVQLDCAGHLGERLSDSPCSSSLSAHIWIDYNDNGHDDGESRLLRRSWSTDGTSTGTFDLDVYIPTIDGVNTKAGQHTMRITVAPSHEYQTNFVAAPTTPYIYRDPLCSVDFGKINLVLMAGEVGTEIRDDLARNNLADYRRNQHHLAVTLYEHTIYLLRIQLQCSSQLKTELTETGCNLAQDINVFLDLNDDGRYDSSDIGAPYRWPVTSYLPDAPNNIEATYAAYGNITCTPQVGKLILVVMGGEHRTQLRDDPSTNALLGTSDEIQQHLSIMLREGVTYLLRLQFECIGHQRNSVENNCHLPHEVSAWIDLDDNGRYDESESATPYRWPLTSYLPQGVYDLQIVVPVIDGRKIKSGPHRMKLVVILNEDYRKKCNINDYEETRYYTVTVVSHTAIK